MMTQMYDPTQLKGWLRAVYVRTGGLTSREIALANAVPSPAPAAKPVVNVQPMLDCFAAARRNGMKKTPVMHIDGFTFKQASNGNAVHVTDNQNGFKEYLGTVRADGCFYPVPKLPSDVKSAILAACADPLKAVLAFGKKFGRCSLCNAKLSDPISIERGVGPICMKKFGL